jgi:hypothetical protein
MGGIKMILDKMLTLSAEQAITATADSTVVEVGEGAGNSGQMALVVDVNTAFTADGAATLAIALQHCDTEGGSYTATGVALAATGKASLTAGARLLAVRLPATTKKYVKLVYTVATGPMTAGKINANIVKDLPVV